MHVRYHALTTLQTQERMHVQVTVRLGKRPNSPPMIRVSLATRKMYMDTHNGTSAGQPTVTQWQKSRRSNPSGNCVEVAELADGTGVAVRNSRDPEGPVLVYTRAEIEAFILGVRDGDFDHLVA